MPNPSLPKNWKIYESDDPTSLLSPHNHYIDMTKVCGVKHPNGSNNNQIALRLDNGQFVSIIGDINQVLADIENSRKHWWNKTIG